MAAVAGNKNGRRHIVSGKNRVSRDREGVRIRHGRGAGTRGPGTQAATINMLKALTDKADSRQEQMDSVHRDKGSKKGSKKKCWR